jgi:hypothetical protein
MRDGKILHIQTKAITEAAGDLLDSNVRARLFATYYYFFASIQTLLDDIEFDRGDWLYILPNKDSTHRLIYKRKPIISDRFLWAPLIDEKDIEITRWDLLLGTREG